MFNVVRFVLRVDDRERERSLTADANADATAASVADRIATVEHVLDTILASRIRSL